MRSIRDERLECLRFAVSLAASKNIQPTEVLKTATDYVLWLDEEKSQPGAAELERLKERFR